MNLILLNGLACGAFAVLALATGKPEMAVSYTAAIFVISSISASNKKE